MPVLETIIGGALSIGGASLINGWRGRVQQKHLSELQQKFQKSIQDKQFADTERLQKEISELQYKNALKLQQANQERDWKTHLNKIELAQSWPLISPPIHYLNLLKTKIRNGKLPLQIILPSSMPEGFESICSSLEQVFQKVYGNAIFYYDGGWKDNMGVRTAQKHTLQQYLSGCPTLILILEDIKSEGKLRLSVTYWGIAANNDALTYELFSIHKNDFAVEIGKRIADELTLQYQRVEAPQALGELIRLRAEENERFNNLAKILTVDSHSNLEQIIADEFNEKYLAIIRRNERILRKVREKSVEEMLAIMGIVGATMTDIQRLLDYQDHPLAMSVIKEFANIDLEELLPLMAKCYADILKSLSEDEFNQPLYCALLASSFDEIPEGCEYAKRFAQEGWQCLQNLYSHDNLSAIEAKTHKEAYRILSNKVMDIQELNNSIKASEKKMTEACMVLAKICSNPENDYDLVSAREILATALEKDLKFLPCEESSQLASHKKKLLSIIEKCRNGRFSVAMVGEYQSGKTTTANALCGGRYVAPMGSGVKTSAMPIIFSYALDEVVMVQWKSVDEFSLVFDTIAPCVDDFEWCRFDLKNARHRKELLSKLENYRKSTLVTSAVKQYFVMAAMILKWYGSPELEEYKRQKLSFDNVQILGRFSDDLSTRWTESGIEGFTFEESLFPLIRMIECRVNSDLLASMRCDVIDCPGLFANTYDTAVTKEVIDKQANAILYLLPYHKAISEEGVGENLIRLKDEYKDIVNRKLFIVNNLQFSNPNTIDIENANKGKVREMFGESMPFVSFDARMAFMGQVALSQCNNSLSSETKQKFIAEVQKRVNEQLNLFNKLRSLRRTPQKISGIEEALRQSLIPYGAGVDISFEDVYKYSLLDECLLELNRFVARNAAYSMLVTEGVEKLKEDLAKWKAYLDLTHIEPHTGGLENLKNLWDNRKHKAEIFSKNAVSKVKNNISQLKNALSSVVCAEVFTHQFFDSLYREIADRTYDVRWDIITGICRLKNKEEGKAKAKAVIESVTRRVLTEKLKERFSYMKNLIEDSNGKVGALLNPTITNLNASLDKDWSEVFAEDTAFISKRKLYYAVPAGVGEISDSIDVVAVKNVAAYGIINPGSEIAKDLVAASLAALAGGIVAAVTFKIAVIILEACVSGGLITLSVGACTVVSLMLSGYTFKEACVATKEKIEESNRKSFVAKVTKKLEEKREIREMLQANVEKAVESRICSLLSDYCNSVKFKRELLEKHGKESVETVENGCSAVRYNKAVSLIELIDRLLKSYTNSLAKLTQLPLLERKNKQV